MPAGEQERIAQLLAPAYRGEVIVLPANTPIDARLFRDHALGINEGADRQSPSPPRWVLHNAVFSNRLDLSDGRYRNGGSLPAMEFHNCNFEGGFCARGAHIERLHFEACRFTATDREANVIELRNIRISTELCLQDLQPEIIENAKDEAGLLWVDAFAAQIGTNVVVKRSLLRAPRNDASSLAHEARYALDLATATIGSDLHLQPGAVLEGGLKIRDARIGGSFWGQALHVTDGETEATRKAIVDRGEQPRYGIFGQSVTIEGILALSADSTRRNEGAIPATLENLEPELSADPMRFWCIGHVNLLGARVGGHLDCRGAHIGGVDTPTIWLDGAEIGGSFLAPKTVTPLVFQRLRRPSSFGLDAATYSMTSCRVAGDCDLHIRAETARLDGLVIHGSLTISGTVGYLSAAGLTVGRDTELVDIKVETCNLGGAKLNGQLDVSGARFTHGLLSIRDAEIGHSFTLAALYAAVRSLHRRRLICYPGYTLSEVTLPPNSDENALLEQQHKGGTRVVSFVTRKGRIPWSLVARWKPWKSPYVRFRLFTGMQPDPTRVVLLDGRSDGFHMLNFIGQLQMHRREQAEEYLRLFCAFTWAEEGSFALVERDSQLPIQFRGKVPVHPLRLVEGGSQNEGPFTFEVYIRYGLSLRNVRFVLTGSGVPEMRNETFVTVGNELAAYLPQDIPIYEYPFRVVDKAGQSDFLSTGRVSRGMDAQREFLTEVPDWSERIVRERLRQTDVDLRDTKCGILHDNAGRIWDSAGTVRLDGFCYAGTFMPTKSSVEGEIQVRRFWLRGKSYQSRAKRARAAFGRFLHIIGLAKGRCETQGSTP